MASLPAFFCSAAWCNPLRSQKSVPPAASRPLRTRAGCCGEQNGSSLTYLHAGRSFLGFLFLAFPFLTQTCTSGHTYTHLAAYARTLTLAHMHPAHMHAHTFQCPVDTSANTLPLFCLSLLTTVPAMYNLWRSLKKKKKSRRHRPKPRATHRQLQRTT